MKDESKAAGNSKNHSFTAKNIQKYSGMIKLTTRNSTEILSIEMKRLSYGPVVIEGWFEDDRIGYYDVESGDGINAIVFIGDIFLTLKEWYYLIPYEFLRAVTTDDLWKRKQILFHEINDRNNKPLTNRRHSYKLRYQLLLELAFIDNILMDRYIIGRFDARYNAGAKIFISHSSRDKQFARWLAIDLANRGHRPWLDEWEILAGESIPTQIGIGIYSCDYVLLLLSKKSVSSKWVECEWQAKYWKEVQANKVMVIPVMIENCKVPILLQSKKYADFRNDYKDGFNTIINAISVKSKILRNISSSKKSGSRGAGAEKQNP